MNIQSPSLHAASREPAPSRLPAAQSPTASGDPAGFASLLRQTQAAPAAAPPAAPQATPAPPAPQAPPPQQSPSAPVSPTATGQDRGASAAPASAHAAAPAAPDGQRPDADPMDNPSTTGATPAPAARDKPRPAGPTGLAQREGKGGRRVQADALTDGLDDTPTGLPIDAVTDQPTDVITLVTTDPTTAGLSDPNTAAAAAAAKAGAAPLPPVPEALPGPTAAPWLAALQPAQRSSGLGPVSVAAPDPSTSTSTSTSASAATTAPAADPVTDPAAADALPASAAANSGLFAQALAESSGVDTAPLVAPAAPREGAARSVDAPIAIGAGFVPTPNLGSTSAAPVAVALAAPVAAPAFAQELGLRMSVLAQGGVQHAELHLNPAEMGPVSVQIVIDGSRARVDFGADVAATRAAIEAGLPALAGALREAGFTLTGGGVSQHSQGRSGHSGGGPAAPRMRRIEGPAIDALTGAARTAARGTVALGGLDLYA